LVIAVVVVILAIIAGGIMLLDAWFREAIRNGDLP